MPNRELVVLGTASQTPTRTRNHNGYLLRWDGEGLLFDPGEGTQRQMLHAGVSATDLTRICVTHFHGDHSLGLAGVIQRINLDKVPHPVHAYYPASGQVYFDRLRQATAYHQTAEVPEHPIRSSGPVPVPDAPFVMEAVALSHPVDSYGYRLIEPGGRRLLPEKLAEFGLRGPIVGKLQRQAAVEL
ncbi:MAG TPA: MBL fold metallo-hydrolase, partial [Streptosporangiaceae bacterium]|nr:MBL fold metallo-hydrolase [Streptosporangiaceae bacterium]